MVAAPYVSALLTNILPYLEFESKTSTIETPIPNLVGMSTASATNELKNLNIKYEIIGNANIVLSQTPSYGNYIENSETKVYLYTEEEKDIITVPILTGKEISEALNLCISLGLNVSISGADGGNVISQSLPPGALVPKGEIIKLTVLITDYED